MTHNYGSNKSEAPAQRCPESAQFWPLLGTVPALGNPSRFQTCRWRFAVHISVTGKKAGGGPSVAGVKTVGGVRKSEIRKRRAAAKLFRRQSFEVPLSPFGSR